MLKRDLLDKIFPKKEEQDCSLLKPISYKYLDGINLVCDFETSTHLRDYMELDLSQIEVNEISVATYSFLSIYGEKHSFEYNYVERNNEDIIGSGNEVLTRYFDKICEDIKKKCGRNKTINLWFLNSSGYDNKYIIIWLTWQKYIQKEELTKIPKHQRNRYKWFETLANNQVDWLSLKFFYKGHLFVVKDFYRFCNEKLAKLGEIIGYQKLDNYDEKFFKDYDKHPQEERDKFIQTYCRRDIEILHKIIPMWNHLMNIDGGVLTLQSNCIKEWKKLDYYCYQNFFKIDNHHYKKGVYRGGFTQVHPLNKDKVFENVYCYDINSSYPYVMSQDVACEICSQEEWEQHPCQYRTRLFHIKINRAIIKDKLIPILKSNYGENNYFQYYYHEKDIHQQTWWMYEEELEWMKKFYLEFDYEVGDVMYFKKHKLFQNYLNKWYPIKQKLTQDNIMINNILNAYKNKDGSTLGFNEKIIYEQLLQDESLVAKYEEQLQFNKVHLIVVKLFLNSLYGKLGQKPINERFLFNLNEYKKGEVILEDDKRWHVESVKQEMLNGYHIYSVVEVDENYDVVLPNQINNFYIASYITTQARIRLYEVAYEMEDDYIYGDTDSVKGKKDLKELLPNEIHSSILGKWKDEGKVNYFRCNRAKTYITSSTRILSKETSKFVISGVNNFDDVYGKDIYQEKLFQETNFKKNRKSTLKNGGIKISKEDYHIIDKENKLVEMMNNYHQEKIKEKEINKEKKDE